MKNVIWMVSAGAMLSLVGCGGGDDEGGGGAVGGSLSSIQGAIESPTGTVSAETAPEVARAYEESLDAPTQGERDDPRTIAAQDASAACTAGGNASVDASSDGSAISIDYVNCCTAADCCVDGQANIFTDTDSGSTCAAYDMTSSCQGTSADLNFSYCLDENFQLTYVVTVEGETYAVSGSLFQGSGTLDISGANGSWSCEYTDYAGSCTSDTGETFDF